MSDARLSNSSVTSSAIRLLGAEITYKFNNLVEANPVPSAFLTTDAQSEVQFMGWENPLYNVRGFVDENGDYPGVINLSFLKQFAKATTSTYFYDDVFAPNGVQVQILDFAIPRVAKTANKKYDYTINFMETL